MSDALSDYYKRCTEMIKEEQEQRRKYFSVKFEKPYSFESAFPDALKLTFSCGNDKETHKSSINLTAEERHQLLKVLLDQIELDILKHYEGK